VFTFALVERSAESRGLVVLPKRDWWPGELIPPGSMCEEGRYSVLVIEEA
jgi:hypothetical protein